MLEPKNKPKNINFASGPCAKPKDWSPDFLKNAVLGRSHRSLAAKEKIKQALALTRELLEIPINYHIAIVPGSDTGAMEMAMWNLLGYKPVNILLYDYFAEEWLYDISQQLKLSNINKYYLDKLQSIKFDDDFVFVLNGTSVTMAINDLAFIPDKRDGLVVCDASAAAFARALDFTKLDVTTFSWQKILGSEAAHGMIILSPAALKRLQTYQSPWPIPKILRLKNKDNTINYELFEGNLLNTPSMLCIEDYINSLLWVKSMGGVESLTKKIEQNSKIIETYVCHSSYFGFLVNKPEFRAKTSQGLVIIDKEILKLSQAQQKLFLANIINYLEKTQIAYDINAYRKAPLGLRIWTGPTVEVEDLRCLCEWLDYAFFREKQKYIDKAAL